MNESLVQNPIPLEVAIQLCAEIRHESEQNWQTESARWCWACQETTGGDQTRRGFLRQPGNRGCILVNARFALLQREH